MKKTKILTVVVLVVAILVLALPMTAMASVDSTGQVTLPWSGLTWPPVISGWVWNPVDGNFAFLTTSQQEKGIHTGDEYAYYSTDPAMTEPNSLAWIKYTLNHNGGKTLPFSYKFTWEPLISTPGYDPSKNYVSYATVTPQIAQLLAANGITLAQLQAGNPLNATSAPAPTKVAVTPASTPAPAKTVTSAPANTTDSTKTETSATASTSTQKVAATLPTPPTKGDLSTINNPDSQTSKDIQTYDANAAKVKVQAAAQAKAAAQQKKVRTYELWVIAGLAVLLVVLLGIGWMRRRKAQ